MTSGFARGRASSIAARPSVGTASRGGRLILTVVILTIFEGAVRKWVVAGSPQLRAVAYFSKDVVFLLAALAGASSATGCQRRYAAWALFAGLLFIVPPSLATLGNVSVIGAVLSFRAYVLIPWCAFLAAGTIGSFKDIERIIMATGIISIGVAVLGVVQFQLPRGHVLNRYDMEVTNIVAQFGHVRAVGPFSYISGMAVMAATAAWAGVYLFLSATTARRRLFAIAVGASGIMCALVSMSRLGLLICIMTIVGGAASFRRGKELLYIGIIGSLALFVMKIGGAEETTDSGMAGAITQRFESGDSAFQRINYMLEDIRQGIAKYPFGTGLGAGQLGGNVDAAANVASERAIENEQGRILFEVGVPGLVGVFLLRFVVVWAMGTEVFSCTDRRLLALYAASLPMVTLAFLVNMVFNHTSLSMTWCVVALVFGAMGLHEKKQGVLAAGATVFRRAPTDPRPR